jgi:hypothetical protein
VDGPATQHRVVLAGEADHGHRGSSGAQPADAHRAGGVGQGEIDQDDVDLRRAQPGDGLLEPFDLLNLDPAEARPAERSHDATRGGHVVLNQQDTKGNAGRGLRWRSFAGGGSAAPRG